MFQLIRSSILDHQDYKLAQSRLTPKVGGVVTFYGKVRNQNHGLPVLYLEYEAYVLLAEKEGQKIVDEAFMKFEVESISCIHRMGRLEIGDIAVWVEAASKHRHPSFRACEYVIDELKKRLPIWKNEFYGDGSSAWAGCDHS